MLSILLLNLILTQAGATPQCPYYGLNGSEARRQAVRNFTLAKGKACTLIRRYVREIGPPNLMVAAMICEPRNVPRPDWSAAQIAKLTHLLVEGSGVGDLQGVSGVIQQLAHLPREQTLLLELWAAKAELLSASLEFVISFLCPPPGINP